MGRVISQGDDEDEQNHTFDTPMSTIRTWEGLRVVVVRSGGGVGAAVLNIKACCFWGANEKKFAGRKNLTWTTFLIKWHMFGTGYQLAMCYRNIQQVDSH